MEVTVSVVAGLIGENDFRGVLKCSSEVGIIPHYQMWMKESNDDAPVCDRMYTGSHP